MLLKAQLAIFNSCLQNFFYPFGWDSVEYGPLFILLTLLSLLVAKVKNSYQNSFFVKSEKLLEPYIRFV